MTGDFAATAPLIAYLVAIALVAPFGGLITRLSSPRAIFVVCPDCSGSDGWGRAWPDGALAWRDGLRVRCRSILAKSRTALSCRTARINTYRPVSESGHAPQGGFAPTNPAYQINQNRL